MATPDLGTLGSPLPASPSGAGGGAPDPTQGAPAPAAGSEPPAGNVALAKAQVSIALSMLNATLAKFQPGTREHKTVMDVTRKLAREFAGMEPSKQLAASETSMLQSQAANSGAATL